MRWGRYMWMCPRSKVTLLGALFLAGAVAVASPLFAQPYPHKPLRLVIPFPGGGGGADYVGRVIGQKLAYNPVRDFAPISLVAEIPNLFLVRPSLLNVPTIKEAGVENSEVTTW